MQKLSRDLAEFGLPFITADDPAFASTVREIESRAQPFGSRPIADPDPAAVLWNQSGKAIIALAHVCRYTDFDGTTRTSRSSNLGTSMQMDVLSGRSRAVRDLGSFMLPGSKRLVTEEGMFGNNLDVLEPHELPRHSGSFGFGAGRGSRGEISREQIRAIELALDIAILEDGLCVGPDEFGLFETLTEALERQRTAAGQVVNAIRSGASEGRVFEILRPLAGDPSEPPGRRHWGPITSMFANIAIRRLTDTSASELLPWFQQYSKPSPLPLHRPRG